LVYVIGSGPAGVACAHGLLEAGATVTMLDPGVELESDRRARLNQIRLRTPNRGDAMRLDFIRDGVAVESGGIPLKLAYGSDFAYRTPTALPVTYAGVEGKPSYAVGGLSNVWGASMMPFRSADMLGWPITADDLAPDYRAVLEFMPYSARRDRLEQEFPLHHVHPHSLNLSTQATEFLEDLEAAHERLSAHGISFGASRLALRGKSNDSPGCVYCGQCMYGCPYGFIYNAADTLDRLRSHERFSYRTGVLVERLAESRSEISISGRNVADATPFSIAADRVFVACGVFSTARLILASIDAYDRTVKAVDNCYFLLPLMRYRGLRNVGKEPLHTLAQAFVEVNDESISPKTVHLQIYSYNDLYMRQIRKMLGPLGSVAGPIADRTILNRLLLIQGYMHSDHSPGIDMQLHRGGRTAPDTLSMSIAPNPATRPALKALSRKLWSERRSMRAIPLSPALRIGKPGRGFHTGGTFPMRSDPQTLETDVLGRLHGFSRLHLVDASVFPTLPATTITLSVMANAHRIGAAAV
jgi:choline dehydrogenase-like flavoprotein